MKEVVGWRPGIASADFVSLSLANATLLYLHSSKIALGTVNNLKMIKAYRIHACYSTFLIRLEHPPDPGVCKRPENSPPEYKRGHGLEL